MSPEQTAGDPAAEALREAAGEPPPTQHEPAPPEVTPPPIGERRENPVVAWGRAIALGIRDTARDVLDEGREGARAKQAEMWQKFDRKTRHRREER